MTIFKIQQRSKILKFLLQFYIIMNIEENRIFSDMKTNKTQRLYKKKAESNLIESFSESQSSNFFNENSRVIKLIHQKIYPLNYLQRSAKLFPKMKEKQNTQIRKTNKENKNYIEIMLEKGQDHTKPRTDLENQRICRYKLGNKKINNKYRLISQKTGISVPNLDIQSSLTTNMAEIYQDRALLCEKHSKTSLYDQTDDNITLFYAEGKRILKESMGHCQFMKKMKQNIKKRKSIFFNKIHQAQLFDNMIGLEKKNFSIQYIVSTIEKATGKVPVPTSPFENYSPNKLGQFAKLFEKQKKTQLLWQQLELAQPILQKQKSSGDELKSAKRIRSNNRNTMIIQYQSQIKLENILSAKYRIKNNHKKMIQLATKRTA